LVDLTNLDEGWGWRLVGVAPPALGSASGEHDRGEGRMAELRNDQVMTGGVELHVVDAGPASGPPIVLSHGFPEIWYSWRFQIGALADAGYHVICPDQRGYGDSTVLPNVEDYGIAPLTDDLLGLLDHFGHDQAVFVGHDWGALIVWGMARLHPRRARAICAMSVPLFAPAQPPIEHFTNAAGPDFYAVHFQRPGFEDEFVKMFGGIHAMFRTILANPPAPAEDVGKLDGGRPEPGRTQPPVRLPAWLAEDDLTYYAGKFEKTGLFGGISYYRNLDANWRLMKDIPYESMTMPILFMTGSLDFVYTSPWNAVAGVEPGTSAVEAMMRVLPDFRGAVFIEGAGHWNQQEKADDTTTALLQFLSEVSPVG
jgi:pimeloyl-ACP methyl ester carboxylesterase